MAPLALATTPHPRKLRVALFADRALQPRWVVEAFARVAAGDFAEIALIATGAPGEIRAGKPLLRTLYDRLDRRVFGATADPLEPLELAQYVPHQRLKTISTAPLASDFPADLDLDVAFALGEVDDAGLDGVARYGVWRWRADGAAEVAAREALSASALVVRLAPGAAPRIAYQSWSRTYPLSIARNREQLLAKTSQFAWRALREAHRSGPGWLEQCKPVRDSGERKGEDAPLAPILGRILQRGVEKALNVEQWFLAVRWGGGREIAADLEGFTRIVPPRDRTWADPFVIEKNGRHFVFFEELPFAAGKAHISMMEVRRDGSHSAPVRVLERDYHLSYPFLVEDQGQLYMIPETAQNRTVEAWRCVDFPLRWRRERVLLEDVRLVDATFHREAGRWWMFANAAAGASRSFDDELHLFHAAQLLGEWQPHRANPVKSDARCARPAGALYREAGVLYRPAQVCVPLYGAGLSINRVLRLTPHEYVERQVARVLPSGKAILGMHTLSRAGSVTVVDAFARRRRFA